MDILKDFIINLPLLARIIVYAIGVFIGIIVWTWFIFFYPNLKHNPAMNKIDISQTSNTKIEKVGGDYVGGDQVTYIQPVIAQSKKDAAEEAEKKIKASKIKIDRYLEDYSLKVEELRQNYLKESNVIASNMSARGIGRSGMHIKAQKDRAIASKNKIDSLFTQLTRNIEDVLMENFNTQLLSEVPSLLDEYNEYNSLKEKNKKMYTEMVGNVKSWDVKINGSINSTKDFTLE